LKRQSKASIFSMKIGVRIKSLTLLQEAQLDSYLWQLAGLESKF